MSRKPAKASDFLKSMNFDTPAAEPEPTKPVALSAVAEDRPKRGRPTREGKRPRSELKHIGGYVEQDHDERFALLKIRLKMDNDQLIAHAIDQVWSAENAKRSFGE